MSDERRQHFLKMATEIVASYLRNNSLGKDEVPDFIQHVYGTIANIADKEPETHTPAVPIDESVTEDYIICLEDGQKFKMLKRHLRSTYNMTPEQYRKKWSLPMRYPMVAPSYARQRSLVARDSRSRGNGQENGLRNGQENGMRDDNNKG